jgi:acetolactate synthase-1/2/3 large subunit
VPRRARRARRAAAPRWAAWTRAAAADYEANRLPTPVAPLDMAEVVATLARLVPDDTVFTNGAGNFSGWLHRFYRYPGLRHAGRTQLAPTSGAMGYGLPAPSPRRCSSRIARRSTSPATATS